MTLCLTMIVRDEEEWIGPALDSALELGVDSWVIGDTGSQDATWDHIDRVLAEVPGLRLDIPWAGYGPARSAVLERVPECDFVLMLDADMTIHGELPTGPGDVWNVEIRGSSWRYHLPLLMSGKRRWRYKGTAHACLASDGPWDAQPSDLWVDDRRPGGWRPGKLEDDARLLEEALAIDPTDSRSSFYLAQTYEDLGRTDDALREYGRRVVLGGYGQERFVAMLRRARILCERDPKLAIGACLEAWHERPTRAEPLYVAARQARRNGWDEAALLFSRQAAEIPEPEDTLFVEEGVYDWGIRIELGIAELRAGDPSAGRDMLRRVQEEGRAPKGFMDWIDELLGEEAQAA